VAFICRTCNKPHDDLPHIGADRPDYWEDGYATDSESLLTEDLCVIEARDYFVRGIIEIPVIGYEPGFGWGVWVSHKKENFEIYRDKFNSAEIGPFFGWLATELAFFADSTLNLKTMAHYRGDNLRPVIEVLECDHPLYRQQQEGITLAEAWDIVHRYMESSPSA
jgi:hypothetical protein